MKAININKNALSVYHSGKLADLTERQPCWYANFDKERAEWIIGVKKSGERKVEHSFPAIEDSTSSPDFAVELIEVFRESGESGVEKWMKERK